MSACSKTGACGACGTKRIQMKLTLAAISWITGWSIFPLIMGQYACTTILFSLQYLTISFCWQNGCNYEEFVNKINMWSVRNQKNKLIGEWNVNHFNLVHGRQVVPRCLDFFNVLDVAFKPQIMSDSIDLTCRHIYATH